VIKIRFARLQKSQNVSVEIPAFLVQFIRHFLPEKMRYHGVMRRPRARFGVLQPQFFFVPCRLDRLVLLIRRR
jgi:hypothetical protein